MSKQEQVLALAAEITASRAPKEVESVEPAPAKAAAPEPEKPEPAPQAAPAPVEAVDDDDTEDSTPSPGSDPTAKPRTKKPGVHQRIDELTREKYEERRAAEQARQEAAYWREQAQRTQAPQAPQPQGKPTLEAFGYDQEAYFEALADWKADQKLQGFKAEQTKAETLRQQQERARKFQERVARFEQEVPGGWQVAVTAPFNPTPAMLEVIAESDIGPRIAHYLATHLDEAHSLAQQGQYAQAAALGRIEAKLSAPPPAPPARLTSAPPPPPSVTGNAPPSKDPARMSMEDHMAAVAAKRRAKFG
jgi:hypothetical protein